MGLQGGTSKFLQWNSLIYSDIFSIPTVNMNMERDMKGDNGPFTQLWTVIYSICIEGVIYIASCLAAGRLGR